MVQPPETQNVFVGISFLVGERKTARWRVGGGGGGEREKETKGGTGWDDRGQKKKCKIYRKFLLSLFLLSQISTFFFVVVPVFGFLLLILAFD